MGISSVDSEEQLKSVYRALSKKHHPDLKNGNEDIMAKINDAYSTLKSKLAEDKRVYAESDKGCIKPTVKIDVESLVALVKYNKQLRSKDGSICINKDNCRKFNLVIDIPLTVKIENSGGKFERTFNTTNRYYPENRSVKEIILNIDDFKVNTKSSFEFKIGHESLKLDTAASRIKTVMDYKGIKIPIIMQVE